MPRDSIKGFTVGLVIALATWTYSLPKKTNWLEYKNYGPCKYEQVIFKKHICFHCKIYNTYYSGQKVEWFRDSRRCKLK